MIINQIKNSIEENKPFFIKSFMDYDFNWEDLVNLISISYNNTHGEEIYDNNISAEQVFNRKQKKLSRLISSSSSGISFHAQDILRNNNLPSNKYDDIKVLKEKLLSIYSESQVPVKFSINLTEGGEALTPHRDTHHVMITQVLGSAKYVVHESLDSDPYGSYINVSGRNFTEYYMKKNDALFLPYGTIHSIDNSTIRAACIFDIECK